MSAPTLEQVLADAMIGWQTVQHEVQQGNVRTQRALAELRGDVLGATRVLGERVGAVEATQAHQGQQIDANTRAIDLLMAQRGSWRIIAVLTGIAGAATGVLLGMLISAWG